MRTAANARSTSWTSRPTIASISPAASCANAPPHIDCPSVRSPLQARDQARRIPAAAAHLLHLGVELIDQRADRQVRAIAPRLGEADRQVLAHPVDRKAEIELALVHGLVAVLHLPRLRGSLGDGLDHA